MPPETPAGYPAGCLVAFRGSAVIPRVTKGSSARGALGYDFGPGRREEHENPRTVAGNVPGTWRDQADLIDAHTAQRPDLSRPIWRSALRAAPEDRTLSDAEWGQIAEQYAARMGFADAPWTATRHGADHIHFTASRLDWNGRVVSDSHDYARAQAACRLIEREHHLADASTRYDRARPQVSHGEKERAARLGVPAERERLRERLSEAERASGGTREGYEKALGERDVLCAANVATTGRVSGYRYGLAGHEDQAGEQVWFKGSQLGKDYSWAATQARLAAAIQGAGRGAQPAAGEQAAVQQQGAQVAAQQAQRRSLSEKVATALAAQERARATLAGARAAHLAAEQATSGAAARLQEAQGRQHRAEREVAAATRPLSLPERVRERLGGYPRAAATEAAAAQAGQAAGEVQQAQAALERHRHSVAAAAAQVAAAEAGADHAAQIVRAAQHHQLMAAITPPPLTGADLAAAARAASQTPARPYRPGPTQGPARGRGTGR